MINSAINQSGEPSQNKEDCKQNRHRPVQDEKHQSEPDENKRQNCSSASKGDGSHSLQLLKPIDKEDQQQFWNFKIARIKDGLLYYGVFLAMVLLLQCIVLFFIQDRLQIFNLCGTAIALLFWGVVLFLSKDVAIRTTIAIYPSLAEYLTEPRVNAIFRVWVRVNFLTLLSQNPLRLLQIVQFGNPKVQKKARIRPDLQFRQSSARRAMTDQRDISPDFTRLDGFIVALPILRLITNSLQMAAIFFCKSHHQSNEPCSTVFPYLVVTEELLINFGFLQDLILWTPSLEFSCLLYTPIFLTTQFVHLILRHESGAPVVAIKLTFFAVLFPMIALYYFQTTAWDLQRFKAEKRLETKHKTQLLRVVETLTDACVIISSTGEKHGAKGQEVPFHDVKYCNRQSKRMFGFDITKETPESLQQRQLRFISRDPSSDAQELDLNQLLAEFVKEEGTTTQKRYRMKNQLPVTNSKGPRNAQKLTLNIRRTKLQFGSEQSLLIVFQDVSPNEKDVQEKKELSSMKQGVTEIRHGINRIVKSQLGLYNKFQAKSPQSASQQLINSLHLSSKQLKSFDLDLGVIVSGDLKASPLRLTTNNVKQTVEEVVDLVKSTSEREINFEIINLCELEFLNFDLQKFNRVLIEILTNAVNSQQTGIIRITIKFVTSKDLKSILTVDVQDRGIGMSDEQIKEALGMFGMEALPDKSLPGQNKKVRGLRIAMKICKQCDGGILALSSIGKGSQLVFTMVTEIPTQEDMDEVILQGCTDKSKSINNASQEHKAQPKSSSLSISLPSGVELIQEDSENIIEVGQGPIPLKKMMEYLQVNNAPSASSDQSQASKSGKKAIFPAQSEKARIKRKVPQDRQKQERSSQFKIQTYLFDEQLELKQGGQNYGRKGQQLIEFMREFKGSGLRKNPNEKGLVMYSDDDYFCRYCLQAYMKAIDEKFAMGNRLVVACNGQQILDYLDTLLASFEYEEFDENAIQPVPLLFLDINMPVLSGLKTASMVKERFKTLNQKIAERKGDEERTYVLRPLICHLTGLSDEFDKVIAPDQEADMFLEKPLQTDDLISLLRLMNLKV